MAVEVNVLGIRWINLSLTTGPYLYVEMKSFELWQSFHYQLNLIVLRAFKLTLVLL